MSNHRNFIRTAAVASVAVALNSFRGSEKENIVPKKIKNLSCCLLGIGEANEVAWQILKNKGRALDAVEAGVKVQADRRTKREL
jgi:N4-(beta-N-acetylglucosaminyl)-L-asparaginase